MKDIFQEKTKQRFDTKRQYRDYRGKPLMRQVEKDLEAAGFDSYKIVGLHGIAYSKIKKIGATLRYNPPSIYNDYKEEIWLAITPKYTEDQIENLFSQKDIAKELVKEIENKSIYEKILDSDNYSCKMECLDCIGVLSIGGEYAVSIDKNGRIQW